MQPENETPTEPIQAQSQKDQPLSQAATPETHKSPKTPWAVAAIASIVAIAGIAFGIYSFMDGNNKSDEITNLKSKISALQSTPEKNDEIEQNEGDAEIANNTSAIYSTLKDTDVNRISQTIKAYSNPLNATDENLAMFVSTSNGELICEVQKYSNSEDRYHYLNGEKLKDCELTAHTGKVVDLVDGTMGNGGENLIFILNTEGEIEYLNNFGEDYSVLKKLNLPKKAVRIYGDRKVMSTAKEGNGAYYPTPEVIIQYTDGTTEGLFSYFNSGRNNS